MLLNESRPKVETSGDIEEKFFSLADEGMLFDILRSKMYSNPILAICREISCNARDAHREVGKSEHPIQIHLPTYLEPYYKVRDWGPGISPDRMVNVFIRYTASTKRNDNTQTGGFGLGAKTPLSYADSFTIVTNFEGKQYNYNCFIDPSLVGKLVLSSESPTNQPNGTEIIVPVEHKDFNDFAIWTEKACRHWGVKPIIKGGDINWTKYESIVDGKNWAIIRTNDLNRMVMIIIDGIEYPLPVNTLRKFKIINSCRGSFIMYFNTGELTLSASRENIFLDDKTKSLISARMEIICNEIKQQVVDKVATFPTLWDANVYCRQELRKIFVDTLFLGKLEWNGIELGYGYTSTGCAVYRFTKYLCSSKKRNVPYKLKRDTNYHVSFEEHSALYINDLPLKELTNRHVRKAFDNDPTLTTLQIIVPTDNITIQDLNTAIHLDKLNAKFLSTITKVISQKYTHPSSRLLVFKFSKNACNFNQTSYSKMDEDTSDKVLCLLTPLTNGRFPSSREVLLENKNYLNRVSLKYLAEKYPNHSFYGVDASIPADRLEEEFSDLENLDDFIEEKVINSGIDFIEAKFAATVREHCEDWILQYLPKMDHLIKDSDSLYLRRLHLHQKIQCLSFGDLNLLDLYESIKGAVSKAQVEKFLADHPELDTEKINEEYKSRYPLIQHISFSSYNFEREVLEPLAGYINLVDQYLEIK